MAKKLHVRHVKSNVLDKAPSASTIDYGEIAVNYNADSPALYIKDDDDNIVKFISEPYFEKIVGTGVTENDGETFTPLSEIIQQDEETIAAAFNDLNERKADKDYVDEAISASTIEVDDHLDSASTNPVENRVIYDVIVENEEITATALNRLNNEKASIEYVDAAVSSITIDVDSELDSGSSNPVENRAIWNELVNCKPNAFYGTCSTAAATGEKAVDCPAFTSSDLARGTIIYVTFDYTSTAAVSSTTMNVNQTGAAGIKEIKNGAIANLDYAGDLQANMTQAFVYTGTYWVLIGADKDMDTTYTQSKLRRETGGYIADSKIYRYQMLFQMMDENRVTPLNNNSNATGNSKTILTNVEFNPFGYIYYYATTTSANTNSTISAAYFYYTYGSGVNLRYTFNSVSLTTNELVYLEVIPQSNGSVKLASSTPLTQTLPTAETSNWFILLGMAMSSYQLNLYSDHPVYTHNGTELIELLNPRIMAGLRDELSITVDSGLTSGGTNPVEGRAIWKAITDNERVLSAAINQLNTNKADKSYVDGVTPYVIETEYTFIDTSTTVAGAWLDGTIISGDVTDAFNAIESGRGLIMKATIRHNNMEEQFILTEYSVEYESQSVVYVYFPFTFLDSYDVQLTLWTENGTDATELGFVNEDRLYVRKSFWSDASGSTLTFAYASGIHLEGSEMGGGHGSYFILPGANPPTGVTYKTLAITDQTLPDVTSADNGKIVMVVNGVWTLTTPTVIYTGNGTPNNSLGNNGDIYLQS